MKNSFDFMLFHLITINFFLKRKSVKKLQIDFKLFIDIFKGFSLLLIITIPI